MSQRLDPAVGASLVKQQKCLRHVSQAKVCIVYETEPTFQHTERHPDKHGLDGPFFLTARCRSATDVQCLRVASHRTLRPAVSLSSSPGKGAPSTKRTAFPPLTASCVGY